MKVQKITKSQSPKCSCVRTEPYANDTPDTDYSCARNASILIDGVPYCRQHAGMYLIDKELGDV